MLSGQAHKQPWSGHFVRRVGGLRSCLAEQVNTRQGLRRDTCMKEAFTTCRMSGAGRLRSCELAAVLLALLRTSVPARRIMPNPMAHMRSPIRVPRGCWKHIVPFSDRCAPSTVPRRVFKGKGINRDELARHLYGLQAIAQNFASHLAGLAVYKKVLCILLR